MRIVIIGATGHIGSYLVPRLVEKGHEVLTVSRGKRSPYQVHGAWKCVQQFEADRSVLEASNQFGEYIREMHPDVVIDLICFTLDSARQLATALQGHVQHLIHCGTIWVHGPSVQVPTREDAERRPFGDYGVQKEQIERYLLEEARLGRIPATILHPGHIVGPGWSIVNPQGNFNLDVFSAIAKGQSVTLPNLGMETVHHVHADDVAQSFDLAVHNWSASTGESFHVVSNAAVSLRGYAETVARWFGQEPNLSYRPFEDWKEIVSKEDARATWDHIAHSPNCSIEKVSQTLGYYPRYSSFEAVKEAVDWLVREGRIAVV